MACKMLQPRSAVCFLVGFLLVQRAECAVNAGNFFHISDIHYDPYYGQALYPNSSCDAEIDVDQFSYGSYLCDSPWSLVELMFEGMSQNLDDPVDFIVWTGDNTAAIGQELLDNSTVLTIIRNLTETIKSYFPQTSVFPAIGNHDNVPRHLVQPQPNAFRDGLAEIWSSWIGRYSGAIATFKQGGYYVAEINANLSMIVLNTAMYYFKDTLTVDNPDPAGQFQWLYNTLMDADNKNTQVYIIAHILPGSQERSIKVSFQPSFNEKYLEILRRYSHVIKGQFYGHHHFDSFRVLYDAKGNPINALFVEPSTTPRNTPDGPRNPSFRVVTYDRDAGDVLDISQYYQDILTNDQNWILEYQATDSYQIPNLSPRSMHDLVDKFTTEEGKTNFFDKYYRYNSARADNRTCDDDCLRLQICAITKLDIPDFEACVSAGQVSYGQINRVRLIFVSLFSWIFRSVMS